ncbi:hypothetical protein [Nocardia niwae]|uniref:hypothetical protein n=1 Tax=Nocardia niwae TaxID=626084 RepID=UPI0007A55070|nr:hypothetical protein [Nocardia niwae]
MPYFYEYQGDDQDLVVESDEPRPDLLEWAYWSEIPAPTKQAAPKVDKDVPIVAHKDDEPEPKPEPAVKKTAPRKAAARKAVEGE